MSLSRLYEIQQEMEELLGEAKTLTAELAGYDSSTYARAASYWIPHIEAALGSSNYGSMCSFNDTLNELAEEEYENNR
jgi:hypothetical protein